MCPSLLFMNYRRIIKYLTISTIIILTTNALYTPKTIVPKTIENEVATALQYFPELQKIPIEFRFKKNIKKSVMMAQPTFGSLFRTRKNRGYIIFISEQFKIQDQKFHTKNLPREIIVGWIGHELGHVMDYQQKNNFQMMVFGLRYVLFKEHVKKAEREADMQAVQKGMANYVIKTKEFILDNANIEEAYKKRIRTYYLSPEEIRNLVKELHAE
jgi:hypothetical protein